MTKTHLLSLCFLLAAACAHTAPGASAPSKKGAASKDAMQFLNAPAIRSQDLEGKVVMVYAWVLACPLCAKEMPDLQSVYEKYKGQGIAILGFASCIPMGLTAVDLPQCTKRTNEFGFPLGSLDQEAVRAYLKSKQIEYFYREGFPIWRVDGKEFKTVYVGRDGKVHGALGVADLAAFEGELKKHL